MAIIKELNEEQTKLVDQYASTIKQIKALEELAKTLRVGIESLVSDNDIEDTIEASTDNYSIEFSKGADSLKLVIPVKDLLKETGNYDILSVSITECKKKLTSEQLSKFFTYVKGSRRIVVK